MENNLENKAKFFAQYWGQDIVIQNEGGGSGFSYDINEATICDIKYDYLKLNPLSSITDEDANAITIYGSYSKNSFTEIGFNTPNGFEYYVSDSVDYLRSKGYATRYLGLSVKKLIEYGWIKLKT